MLPGLVVACVGSFEWLLGLLTFRSKWQVRWCRLISCRRVCLRIRPRCWRFDCGKPCSWLWAFSSSSSSWYLLKCSWNVGQLCSCAGCFIHSQISWVKTPARCRMIIPILISCSLVAGDFLPMPSGSSWWFGPRSGLWVSWDCR